MSTALLSDLKNRRFLQQAGARWFFLIGIIASAGQIADWVFGVSEQLWWGHLIGTLWILGLPSAIWWSWPRPIEETYDRPNTTIRIIKGDIFAQQEHLVIGTCDTFDTAPPHIIARQSLQGLALEHLYNNDIAQLDKDLDAALSDTEPSGHVTKDGKTARYPIGTVAVLNHRSRQVYFVAYTEMDENNNAQGTPEGLWVSLNSLWAEISRSANGGTICIPVIGGGMSRLSQIVPNQDSLRFTILSFMFASRKNKVCDELRIVMRPQDYDKLDRLELQAFLTSLKPS
ncbi:macro domain-containing protein [Mycobacteroides abscessus]|uniref:macro domain-containing protein n=1 Tax=Mycobacteroides abscessus TaxID=36809 RepID=UPI00092C2766|nr:macro domain-containing protein [Mycobacteroides abscessus]SHQ43783.1 Uncharacterised protein [Mycobacteroides abscessus subsp. abscessus]SHR10963.1 Uncharacterised protein [Mycobacteroides abscessus subsp. abscessus]SHR37178.1 Uncharacterised protein [Mycobacteroides abscessus subsp. abscessus]SHS77934.1 Uncharacterised protein [Mycobacteroides abscessus subsp. abscessus]SHT23612.1 Uncharacterised protein [Mycobacteroides abscessus subsp. abscessus]